MRRNYAFWITPERMVSGVMVLDWYTFNHNMRAINENVAAAIEFFKL